MPTAGLGAAQYPRLGPDGHQHPSAPNRLAVIVRQGVKALQLAPERRGVIGLDQVRELVEHDRVDEFGWQEQ